MRKRDRKISAEQPLPSSILRDKNFLLHRNKFLFHEFFLFLPKSCNEMIYLTRQVVLDEANYKSWRNGLFALLIKVLFFTIVERQIRFLLLLHLSIFCCSSTNLMVCRKISFLLWLMDCHYQWNKFTSLCLTASTKLSPWFWLGKLPPQHLECYCLKANYYMMPKQSFWYL